jgi:hypothetical protein
MTLRHRAAWIELGLFLVTVGLLVWAVLLQIWLGIVAAVVLAVLVLPPVVDGIRGARRGLPWEGREFELTFLPSRAQQFAVGVPFMLGYTIWRIVDSGWLGAVFSVPFLIGYLIWFVHVRRTEGWSGAKRDAEDEQASSREA